MELPEVPHLIKKTKLRDGICKLGDKIEADYRFKEVLGITVLTGEIRFTGSIMGRTGTNIMLLEPVVIRGYRGIAPGPIEADYLGLNAEVVENKHVLLFDDIVDTGRTLSLLNATVRQWNPKSVKTVAMLYKTGCQHPEFNIVPDYYAFSVPNCFVVGFGIDYRGLFRNLNYIGELTPKIQQTVDHLVSG